VEGHPRSGLRPPAGAVRGVRAGCPRGSRGGCPRALARLFLRPFVGWSSALAGRFEAPSRGVQAPRRSTERTSEARRNAPRGAWSRRIRRGLTVRASSTLSGLVTASKGARGSPAKGPRAPFGGARNGAPEGPRRVLGKLAESPHASRAGPLERACRAGLKRWRDGTRAGQWGAKERAPVASTEASGVLSALRTASESTARREANGPRSGCSRPLRARPKSFRDGAAAARP
jgi:hypothetical protein